MEIGESLWKTIWTEIFYEIDEKYSSLKDEEDPSNCHRLELACLKNELLSKFPKHCEIVVDYLFIYHTGVFNEDRFFESYGHEGELEVPLDRAEFEYIVLHEQEIVSKIFSKHLKLPLYRVVFYWKGRDEKRRGYDPDTIGKYVLLPDHPVDARYFAYLCKLKKSRDKRQDFSQLRLHKYYNTPVHQMVLQDTLPVLASHIEWYFYFKLMLAGLRPICQYKVQQAGEDISELDFAIFTEDGRKIAIELDGFSHLEVEQGRDGRFYYKSEDYEKDRKKDLILNANGWIVLRLSRRQIEEDAETVVNSVLKIYHNESRR